MRILMSLADHAFPPDNRVEKEARTLLNAGHEVFLLCPNQGGRASEEVVEGVKVFRVWIPHGFFRRIWSAGYSRICIVNPFWRKSLARIVQQERIEVIHVHDLPMVSTGLSVAQEFGVSLVADLHEHYPTVLQLWRTGRNWPARLVNSIIDSHWYWKKVERSCVRRADRVITVSDELKDYYVKAYGISTEKVAVVMNTEDLDYLYSIAVQEEITKKYESSFAILYVGVLGPHRGIETAIEAMPQILQTIPNAKLLLVGTGSNEVKLKQLASKRQLGEVVEFTGWQDFDLVPSYIAASNICLHTFIDTTLLQSRASSANKVFHYMAMGKPTIVASSQEAMSRLVRAADAGIEYSAGDPHSLAQAVLELYRDKDFADKLGEAGRKAVREKYNWNVEGAKLVSLYRDLSL